MTRSRKVEFVTVAFAILIGSATLTYRFRFDPRFRYEVASALEHQGDFKRAIPHYIRFLRNFPDAQFVGKARKELFSEIFLDDGWPVDESVLDVALQALSDHDKRVRRSAALTLGQLDDPLARKALRKVFMEDPEQYVRDAAELALLTAAYRNIRSSDNAFKDVINWWLKNVGVTNNPPGTVFVPAGRLTIRVTSEETQYELSADFVQEHKDEISKGRISVEVQPFFIDKFEVTNAQFNSFVQRTGYEPRTWEGKVSKLYCSTESLLDVEYLVSPDARLAPYHPAIVDWHDASAYARWLGKRLPADSEWQLAAGAADGRMYPWGNEAPDAGGAYRANYYPKAGQGADGYILTAPVGSFEADRSVHGCYDMAGNAYEWCVNWHDASVWAWSGGSYNMLAVQSLRIDGAREWQDLTNPLEAGVRCVLDLRWRHWGSHLNY